MKPNCQEPIGEIFQSVYLSACCASDILILNVFLFNNHIIKGERSNYLKKLKAFTTHCVGKEKKKKRKEKKTEETVAFTCLFSPQKCEMVKLRNKLKCAFKYL